jgi:hypothetical protein
MALLTTGCATTMRASEPTAAPPGAAPAAAVAAPTDLGAGPPREPPPQGVWAARPLHEIPAGSQRWRTHHQLPSVISGYTTVVSGPPGTVVGLRVSTTRARFRVLAFRIGAYRGGTGRLVWRSAETPGDVQPGPTYAPYDTRTAVADWRTSVRVETAGWRPGFYVLKLVTTGAAAQVPYVVSSRSTAGTVVLSVPVATWQAYNVWGGYSLYRGPPGDRHAWAVSFDRPYGGVGGYNDFRTSIVPLVVEAESTGVRLSYLADVELDRRPGLLAGARGYVSLGHAEYWTPAMMTAVIRARDSGTNLAFLGANTAYWRIRLSPRDGRPARLETGYRDDASLDPLRTSDPAAATSRFRDRPDPRPENAMVGMLYECYPVTADYRIVTPRWWGFAGTGVHRGSVVHGMVGGETDRVYPDRHMPRPLQVLSDTPYGCRGVPTSSQAVYYTTPSGAGVFAAGTLRWGCALVDACDSAVGRATTRFVRIVTGNLLRAFAAGPVGTVHPARDNVGRFDLPLRTTVSAS